MPRLAEQKLAVQQNNALMDLRRQGMDLDRQRFGMEQEQNALKWQQVQQQMAEMAAFRKAVGELENNTPEGHAQLQRRFPMLYKEAGLSSMLPEQPKPITGNFVGEDGQYTVYSADPTTGQSKTLPLGKARESQPQTVVNLGDGEFAKARAKSLSDEYDTVRQKSTDAQETLTNLYMMQSTSVDSGLLEDLKTDALRLAEGLGVPLDPQTQRRITNNQSYNSMVYDLLRSRLAAQKGPQTEGDAARMLKTLASLKNTNDARKFVISAAIATEQRKVDEENFYLEWEAENGDMRGARKAWLDFKRNTPIMGVNNVTGRPVFYTDFIAQARQANPDATDEELLTYWRQKYGAKNR